MTAASGYACARTNLCGEQALVRACVHVLQALVCVCVCVRACVRMRGEMGTMAAPGTHGRRLLSSRSLRQGLARDYAEQRVLSTWANAELAAAALADVSRSLLVDSCLHAAAPAGGGRAPPPPPSRLKPPSPPLPPQPQPPGGSSGETVYLYVAPGGNDAAAGTTTAPLATVAGAQAMIRALHPGPNPPPTPARLYDTKLWRTVGSFSRADWGTGPSRT